MAGTHWDALRERRTAERRARAVEAARRAVAALERRGVRVLVFGSLARGDFALHSDVDLLVTDCPEGLHYRIESAVEDVMGGLPFHVCYLDELPAGMRDTALREAIDASDLRPTRG